MNRSMIFAGLMVLAVLAFAGGCGSSGGGGSSGSSGTLLGTPYAPSTPTLTAGNGQVGIVWSAVTDATSYNIYWSTAVSVTKSSGAKILNASSPYVHNGLTNGTAYYYAVTALNNSGESPESAVVSATPTSVPVIPAAPANVTIIPGNRQVIIIWPAATGAISYNLYWYSNPVDLLTTPNIVYNVTSPHIQTGLANGVTYYFRLGAVNGIYETIMPGSFSAQPDSPPSTPANLMARVCDSTVILSWDKVNGAGEYYVYWSLYPGELKRNRTQEPAVSNVFTHTGLANGTTYYYVVTALNTYGESGETAEAAAAPMALWAKSYAGPSSEEADAVCVATDGGYFLAGQAMGMGADSLDFWVVRTNSAGNIVWQKDLGGNGFDAAYAVRQSGDGGCIVVGRSDSFSAGDTDIWLIKLGSDGSMGWQKTFGSTGHDIAYDVLVNADGFLVAGYTQAVGGTTDGKLWLIQLDSAGARVWEKTYTYSYGQVMPKSINPTADNGYIIGGSVFYYSGGTADALALKVDVSGTVQWQKIYGGTSWEYLEGIKQLPDGGYLAGGATKSYGAGEFDAWALRLNSTGNILWQKSYGGYGDDRITSMELTADNGCILAGSTYSFGSGAWVLKLNSDGACAWQKVFQPGGAYAVSRTADNNYAVAGLRETSSGWDFWLLKMSADGMLGTLGKDTTAQPTGTLATAADAGLTSGTLAIDGVDTSVAPINTGAVMEQQMP